MGFSGRMPEPRSWPWRPKYEGFFGGDVPADPVQLLTLDFVHLLMLNGAPQPPQSPRAVVRFDK